MSVLLAERTNRLLFALKRKEAKGSSPAWSLLANCCKARQSSAELGASFVPQARKACLKQSSILVDCRFYEQFVQEAQEDGARLLYCGSCRGPKSRQDVSRNFGAWGICTDPRSGWAAQWNHRRGLPQNQQLEIPFWGGPFRAVPQSPLHCAGASRLREAAPAVLLLLQPKRRWFGSLPSQRTGAI